MRGVERNMKITLPPDVVALCTKIHELRGVCDELMTAYDRARKEAVVIVRNGFRLDRGGAVEVDTTRFLPAATRYSQARAELSLAEETLKAKLLGLALQAR